jgi:hypothetical protein
MHGHHLELGIEAVNAHPDRKYWVDGEETVFLDMLGEDRLWTLCKGEIH